MNSYGHFICPGGEGWNPLSAFLNFCTFNKPKKNSKYTHLFRDLELDWQAQTQGCSDSAAVDAASDLLARGKGAITFATHTHISFIDFQ